jgi:uncharacterized membrane protein
MDPGLAQIARGLAVGGVGLPVVSAVIGLVVRLVTAGAIKMMTATRVVFLILGATVVTGMSSGKIPVAEGAACLVAQVVAWGLLLGPSKRR